MKKNSLLIFKSELKENNDDQILFAFINKNII